MEEGGGVPHIVLTAAIAGAGVVVGGGTVGDDDIAKVDQSNGAAFLLVLAKCGLGSTTSVRYENSKTREWGKLEGLFPQDKFALAGTCLSSRVAVR